MTGNTEIQGHKIPPQLRDIARMVKLMDSEFRVPGTKITFGIDPIIGLIPGLGDLIDYTISGYLMLAMVKNGASSKVVAKMLANITLDAIIGLIPLVGRIFDVFYKANRRNLVLAIEHFEEGKHEGSARGMIISLAVVMFVMFLLLGIGVFFLLKWLFLLFGQVF